MARPYRFQGEHCFYHITSRGNDRKKIYENNSDYRKFLDYILKAKEKYKFYLYAYVLMPNHYHLLLETIQPNISRIMQYINTSYTIYYNIKNKKYGHLFQGRYKSILIDKDNYFLELTRYIHLNPVRANIEKQPEKYKWSSYKGYIAKNGDGYIDKEQLEKNLNMEPEQYWKFVINGMGKDDKLFENIHAGSVLGKKEFYEEKVKNIREKIKDKDYSYRKTLNASIEPEEIIAYVSKNYAKETTAFCTTKRRSIKEKKIAIYLLKRLTELTNKEIGEKFGITYSAVSKVTVNIERILERDQCTKQELERLISHFKV